MIREAIYLGRSNTIDWQLQADKEAVNLSSVTRVVATIAGIELDSDLLGGNGDGNAFHWTSGVPAEGVANLFLRLGVAAAAANVPLGRQTLRLVVYDPDNTNGVVWVDGEEVFVS